MQETQEMQVWSLGWEDPLEEEMATHSSILACKLCCMDRGAWWATGHGPQSQTWLTICTHQGSICDEERVPNLTTGHNFSVWLTHQYPHPGWEYGTQPTFSQLTVSESECKSVTYSKMRRLEFDNLVRLGIELVSTSVCLYILLFSISYHCYGISYSKLHFSYHAFYLFSLPYK